MYTVECPVWLDKIFLEESLRAGYNDETLSIANYNVRLAIAKGDNYTSNMYRVTMETTRNRTFSVIIKHLLDTGKAGDMVQKSTAYLREKTMLTAVLPKMAALLQNAMPGKLTSRL
jgi:dihydroxyacetone kinase